MSGLETVALAAALGSGVLGAVGAIQQGEQQAAQAKFAAQQQEAQAKQERAVSQRKALQARREQQLLQSKQLAIAAAQGGASDPSVLDIFADTAAKGELSVQRELAIGEQRARGLVAQAEQTRIAGEQARQAGIISGVGGLLSSASQIYTSFGSPKLSPTQTAGAVPTYG